MGKRQSAACGSGPQGGDGSEPEGARLQPEGVLDVYADAPIGLCYLDLDLRYVQINEWLAAVNGLTVDEHLGRTIGEVLPDVARGVEKELRRVITSGEPIESGIVRAETPAHPGVLRTFEHNFHPVRSRDGTVVGVSCTVQDVAERESAKKSLRWYRSVATASRDLMAFVDPTYTYRAANQAYCDEHQRTLEEIVGHTVTEVFGRETFEGALKPHLDRCLKGEHVSFGFWWTSPSRGRRHVEARYDPSYEADGSLSGVAVNVRDTTERKQIEEQHERSLAELEAANEELELFSASLAHDLRNPLLIVTNFSANLEEELGDSLEEQQKADLQRIQGAGQHMMHILEDLRDLADVSRGEINREKIDLSSLAQEIMNDMRAVIQDHDVTFEAEPGIIAVGDKTLIRILLSNLLQNAWKYTRPCDDARIELGVEEHESVEEDQSIEEDGSIQEHRNIGDNESTAEAENESDGPVYYVRDNGIGFDNADGEVIFRAFERLHTKGEFPGSGLGLATVERIIRRHGGRVWADGTPGKGATFRFTLAAPPMDDRRREQRSRGA